MDTERLTVFGPEPSSGYYFVVFQSTAKNYAWGITANGPDVLQMKTRWSTDPNFAVSMSEYPYSHLNPTVTMRQLYDAYRVINETGDFVTGDIDLQVVAKARQMGFDERVLDEIVMASKAAEAAFIEASILLNRIRHFKA